MASVGFEGAFGADALSQAIRQQLMDKLDATIKTHGMSVEDQKLALEKQRFDQEAQDRAMLRQQQGATFNAKIGQATATNMGAGRTVMSPDQASSLVKLDPSLAPLMSADQTLPSTQFAGGGSAPDISPALAERFVSGTLRPLSGAASSPSTAPTITQQAPQATGNVAFAGLPALNKQAADEASLSQLASDQKTPPTIRGFLQMRQLLPKGENIPYQLLTEPNGPSQPLEQVATPTGPKYVPRNQAVGATPYHVPPQAPQPIIVQTDSGFQSVNRGTNTATPVTDAAGDPLKPKIGATLEARVKSAQTVAQVGNELIAKLRDPSIAAKLGPAMSRYDTAADFFGNPPPEFSFLKGAMESYALANMGVHGMRSNTGAEAIKATLGLNRLNPENIVQTILGLNSFAVDFMKNNGVMPAASHETVGPPTPASAAWKVIRP